MAQGYTATLVAATLFISRSSLYYRKQLRKSRGPAIRPTNRSGLRKKTGVRLSPRGLVAAPQKKSCGDRKRALRAMRERGLLVRSPSEGLAGRRSGVEWKPPGRIRSSCDVDWHNEPFNVRVEDFIMTVARFHRIYCAFRVCELILAACVWQPTTHFGRPFGAIHHD